MKTFELTATFTISGYTKVEAETLEEAIEIADNRPTMGIVTSGADTEDDSWMIDEIDGEPENIIQQK